MPATEHSPHSRRERQRRATIGELKAVARELLVDDGVPNVTIRAVAREVGLTSPAVYRYFDGRDALLAALRAEIVDEVSRQLRLACGAPGQLTAPQRLMTAGRALRQWALSHRNEFTLLLTPAPVAPGADADGAHEQDPGWAFSLVFAELMADLWHIRPFPVAAEGSLPPGLAARLDGLRAGGHTDLPVEAIAVMLRCWLRLYGLICMEIQGHLRFALDDGAPFFERELADACDTLGIGDLYSRP